jgi:paraquat-inducible protein B
MTKNANGALGINGYGPNSEFQRNMDRMMSEMNDAARSFRVLADYLDRHPEALIRGRASQASER